MPPRKITKEFNTAESFIQDLLSHILDSLQKESLCDLFSIDKSEKDNLLYHFEYRLEDSVSKTYTNRYIDLLVQSSSVVRAFEIKVCPLSLEMLTECLLQRRYDFLLSKTFSNGHKEISIEFLSTGVTESSVNRLLNALTTSKQSLVSDQTTELSYKFVSLQDLIEKSLSLVCSHKRDRLVTKTNEAITEFNKTIMSKTYHLKQLCDTIV